MTTTMATATAVNETDDIAYAMDDLVEFKYYSEGVLLTPISVFGIIGKYKWSSLY